MSNLNESNGQVVKIIGIGGGGVNMIANACDLLYRYKVGNPKEIGQDFIAMNTDQQSLMNHWNSLPVDCRFIPVQLGIDGTGAGANPEVGRTAVRQSEATILKAIGNSGVVVIFACLGGGTGSAVDEAVRIAKKDNKVVMVFVTLPYAFEGRNKQKIAQESIARLREYADLIVVISNQSLFEITEDSTSIEDAFAIIDDYLCDFAIMMRHLFKNSGKINIDFADVRTAVQNNKGFGAVYLGFGMGKNAAFDAVDSAIKNALMKTVNMQNATHVLLQITSSRDLSLKETQDIVQRVQQEVRQEDTVIRFGLTILDNLQQIYTKIWQKQKHIHLNADEQQDSMGEYGEMSAGEQKFKSTSHERYVKVMILISGLSDFDIGVNSSAKSEKGFFGNSNSNSKSGSGNKSSASGGLSGLFG